VFPDLVEWNYGEYEGLTPKQIEEMAPDWLIFRDGCPGGEAPEHVSARVDRVIARSRAVDGDTVLFAHGHVLRVLLARWIGLPPGHPANAGRTCRARPWRLRISSATMVRHGAKPMPAMSASTS
jgi:broad specificity phosphatase PhoE